jgi:hypothetical protein
MVIILAAHEALTPTGKPLAPLTPALLMPVALMVAMVIGVSAVLMQSVGEDEGVPKVLRGLTVTVLVTAAPVQEPNVGVIV